MEFNRQSLLSSLKVRLPDIITVWYLAGMTLFIVKVKVWDYSLITLWFFWVKALLFLHFANMYVNRPKRIYLVVLIYSLFNALWEILVLIMGWAINETPYLDILYFVTLATAVYLTIRK